MWEDCGGLQSHARKSDSSAGDSVQNMIVENMIIRFVDSIPMQLCVQKPPRSIPIQPDRPMLYVKRPCPAAEIQDPTSSHKLSRSRLKRSALLAVFTKPSL